MKIAAIGTLADVVPLVGENRVIAKLGLEQLIAGPAQGRPAGAARRVGAHRQDHRQLPHRVHGGAAGQRRRAHVHRRYRDAAAAGLRRGRWRPRRQRSRSSSTPRTRGAGPRSRTSWRPRARMPSRPIPTSARTPCSSSAGDGWHRGVIGIVASKLVDAYYRPAIVLSVEDGVAHGSCRSIPGFDVLAALESCAPLLHALRRPQAGGRPAARGGATFRRSGAP